MDSMPAGTRSARSLLGNGPFVLLWAAQFIAVAAVYAVALAGLTLVEELTRSTTLNALTLISAILPAFLGSLIAGAVVDRLGRVRVLVASQGIWALAGLAFWATTAFLPPFWAIVAAMTANAVMALVTQFAMAAQYACLPDYAGQALLLRANSLFQISFVAGEGLGVFLLAPLLVKVSGIPSVGLVAALLSLLGLLLVVRLPQDAARASSSPLQGRDWAALAADLRAGWRAIAQDRVLSLAAVQATAAAALLLVLVALLPGLASRQLGMGAENIPYLLLPGGLGFLLGLVLVNRWEDRLPRLVWIGWGLTGVGLGIGLLAAASGTPPLLGLMLASFVIIGLGLGAALIPARTVLQERPPAEVRGRVISAQLALGNAAALLPMLLGGGLADRFGIQPVLVLTAFAALGAGLGGLALVRGHRFRSGAT